VHNIIRVDTGTDEGKLIARLIDTAEFQRLRRVRQLGLAYFAYQTAEHSRFTHSLGAFHLASRILEKLGSKYGISDKDRIGVRVAALLHDVGHGPFSHVIETILGFHHEDFTVEAVLSDETEIGQTLKEFSPNIACRCRRNYQWRVSGRWLLPSLFRHSSTLTGWITCFVIR